MEKIKVPVLMQFGTADNHTGFSDPEVLPSPFLLLL